jgi:hypothetical protein
MHVLYCIAVLRLAQVVAVEHSVTITVLLALFLIVFYVIADAIVNAGTRTKELEAPLEALFNGRRVRTNAEFVSEFYPANAIPPDIPIFVRGLVENIVGISMSRIEPTDRIFEIYDEIDVADVLRRIERHYQADRNLAVLVKNDWSFDDFVKYSYHCSRQKGDAAPG